MVELSENYNSIVSNIYYDTETTQATSEHRMYKKMDKTLFTTCCICIQYDFVYFVKVSKERKRNINNFERIKTIRCLNSSAHIPHLQGILYCISTETSLQHRANWGYAKVVGSIRIAPSNQMNDNPSAVQINMLSQMMCNFILLQSSYCSMLHTHRMPQLWNILAKKKNAFAINWAQCMGNEKVFVWTVKCNQWYDFVVAQNDASTENIFSETGILIILFWKITTCSHDCHSMFCPSVCIVAHQSNSHASARARARTHQWKHFNSQQVILIGRNSTFCFPSHIFVVPI